MPDDGGVNDQAAFVMSAFTVLEQAMAEYSDWKSAARGG